MKIFNHTIYAPNRTPNPFKFSTKYLDNETQLYYYGYRYYNPENGRWINRDPIQERGGKNLYGFVINNSIQEYDLFGLTNDSCQCYTHEERVEFTKKYNICVDAAEESIVEDYQNLVDVYNFQVKKSAR